MGLCKVEKGNTYTLKDFKDAQINQLREVTALVIRMEIAVIVYIIYKVFHNCVRIINESLSPH